MREREGTVYYVCTTAGRKQQHDVSQEITAKMFFFRREIRSFKQFGRVTYKEDDAGLHLSAKIARMLNNITR